jgi:hypothetical protein
MADGFRYLARWRGLLILTGTVALSGFLVVPAGSLVSLCIQEHFRGGPMDYLCPEKAKALGKRFPRPL